MSFCKLGNTECGNTTAWLIVILKSATEKRFKKSRTTEFMRVWFACLIAALTSCYCAMKWISVSDVKC